MSPLDRNDDPVSEFDTLVQQIADRHGATIGRVKSECLTLAGKTRSAVDAARQVLEWSEAGWSMSQIAVECRQRD